MPAFTEHVPGSFCWVELMTTDPDGAKRFYGELMGWQHHDDPIGPDAVYTMLLKDGRNVGALYRLGAEQAKQGTPPHWGAYVSVASVDAVAGLVGGLGGRLLMEPFDVMAVGRMAVLQDPTGGILSLWQPKQHIGFQLRDEPGSVCWNELLTHDTQKAGAFYAGLFGWKPNVQPMGSFDYTSFMLGERYVAGMMPIQAEWGPMPTHWFTYFKVIDCDASAAKAAGIGGKVASAPCDIPEVGRFAVLVDPQGASFGILAGPR
jgi:hypothetical protein